MGARYRFIMVNLLVVLSAACGFQLRGQVQLPPSLAIVYLKIGGSGVAPPSEFAAVLRRTLEANGAVMTDDPQAATATLEILREDTQQRTLATSRDDQVRSHTLHYSVEYTVTAADGSLLVPLEQVGASQDFVYREADVLGKAEGERLLLRNMMSDVASAILRRIQVAAS